MDSGKDPLPLPAPQQASVPQRLQDVSMPRHVINTLPPVPPPLDTVPNGPTALVQASVVDGEIQNDSFDMTPIRGREYQIHSGLDLAVEDDEMLAMQIQLAETQEALIMRKIESKKVAKRFIFINPSIQPIS
jgi:hypothetical protein